MQTATPSVTVTEILDRYQQECVPLLSPRSRVDYVRHLDVLRREFGHRIAGELVPRDFGPFLYIQGKGKIQRNRMIAVLSSAFSQAVGRWYWLDRNVLKDVKRNPAKPRTRYVTDEEYETCKALAPKPVQLAMDLALLTGQRQGDLLSLKWEQLSETHIFFTQAKTGKKLALEISPAVEEVLNKCWMRRKYNNEFVIGTRNGRGYVPEGFRASWQRTQSEWQRKTGGERFTFHDLRAKSASDSATIDLAYQRLGHTSIGLTRRIYDRGVRVVKPLR